MAIYGLLSNFYLNNNLLSSVIIFNSNIVLLDLLLYKPLSSIFYHMKHYINKYFTWIFVFRNVMKKKDMKIIKRHMKTLKEKGLFK